MPVTRKANSEVLSLGEKTAADLMTPNPHSLRDSATIKEAVVFLTDKGYSAAPVIDHRGQPVGVLSRSDLLTHQRENPQFARPIPEFYSRSDLAMENGERLPEGFQVEATDVTPIRELMTPVVFSVTPDATARRVVEDMVAWKIHRVFVVESDGVLVGVISAIDVLRHLL
jgi:acetoin utilization protein AcuB